MAEILSSVLLPPNSQPKRSDQGIMLVDSIPLYLIYEFDRPSRSSDDLKVDHINTYRKMPGKTTYGDVKLKIYDFLNENSAQVLEDWGKIIFNPETGTAGYLNELVRNVSICLIDGYGTIVEKWTLINAWPKEITYSPVTWSKADIMNIDVTLVCDRAAKVL